MRKKVSLGVYLVSLFIVGIMCLIVGEIKDIGIVYKETDIKEVVSLEYQDDFSNLEIYDYTGEKVENFAKDKPTVIFYLSNTCKTCVEDLKEFKKIMMIFGEKEINFCILWEEDYSKSLLEKRNIDLDYAYMLGGERKLASPTPTFYVTDETGKIVFYTIELDIFIEKLIDLNYVEKEKLIENSNSYFKEIYNFNGGKPILIYFAMEGCPDCEAVEPLVESKDITNEYDVYKIYKYDDVKNEIKDSNKLFKQIYDIEWYPSFLIIDQESYQIIGEVSQEELASLLLSSYK